MTNARWFGVYKHSIGHRQFTCGIGLTDPKAAHLGADLETPLLYLVKVRMKDGSVPPDQLTDYPSLSF